MRGEKESYKYLQILEADTIKQMEMKEKIKKEYQRRPKKLHESKLYRRNLIKWTNTWTVHLVKYSGPFLRWTTKELKWTREQENTWQCRRFYMPEMI